MAQPGTLLGAAQRQRQCRGGSCSWQRGHGHPGTVPKPVPSPGTSDFKRNRLDEAESQQKGQQNTSSCPEEGGSPPVTPPWSAQRRQDGGRRAHGGGRAPQSPPPRIILQPGGIVSASCSQICLFQLALCPPEAAQWHREIVTTITGELLSSAGDQKPPPRVLGRGQTWASSLVLHQLLPKTPSDTGETSPLGEVLESQEPKPQPRPPEDGVGTGIPQKRGQKWSKRQRSSPTPGTATAAAAARNNSKKIESPGSSSTPKSWGLPGHLHPVCSSRAMG